MNRAATIVLAFLLALAGAVGVAPRGGAAAADPVAACCGGDCRCGEGCRCAADEAPSTPADDSPALPERMRGERAPFLAVPLATTVAVGRGEPVDVGARCAASSELAAPPCCRLRLALVSRWTT